MKRVVVTRDALTRMVREALWNKEFSGWSSNHDEPAVVNAGVDASAAVTDPVNPNFSPQDKTEFAIAVNQLAKNVSDDEIPKLFFTVKTAIEQEQNKDEEADMKDKAAQGGTDQVEEALRASIRNILAEAKPDPWKNAPPVTGPLPPVTKIPAGVHGGEYQRRIDKSRDWLRRGMGKAIADYEKPPVEEPDVAPAGEEGEPAAPEAGPAVTPRRKAYKATALGSMDDVGGASLDTIAKELGFSVAGAKQAVDKALEKAKFLAQDMDPDDLEILVLTTMNDYIKYLSRSDEVTPADVQLMKDHPEIVRDLDGFREFMSTAIQRARKGAQLIDPAHDEEGAGLNLDDDEEELEAKTSADEWQFDDVVSDSPEEEEDEESAETNKKNWHFDDVKESRRPVLRLR